MYGGLQAGIGLLAGLAVFRERLREPALWLLVFVCAGLGTTRLVGAMLAGEVSSYTGSTLAFEIVLAGAAAWLLSRPAAIGQN
jgi:hypothetical protein